MSWVKLACQKCGAGVQVQSERIAFKEHEWAGTVAVDTTGWAARNGGHELLCPFHGPGMAYYLEAESRPRGKGAYHVFPGEGVEP